MSEETSGTDSGAVSDSIESTETSQVQSGGEVAEGQVADLQDQLDSGNLSKSEKKEVQKMLKKLQIKIDGREESIELPFEIPDTEDAKKYMTQQLQMSKMAGKRAQEKAEYEKLFNQFMSDLKTDPRKLLKNEKLGVDFKKMVMDEVEEELARANKSPEEIAREDAESRIRAEREKLEEEKAAITKEREEAARIKYAEEFDRNVSRALEKADLPKTAYTILKLTDYMIAAGEAGEELDVETAAKFLEEDMSRDITQMFQIMSPEKLKQLVGSEALSKISKSNIAAAKKVKETMAAQPNAIKDTGVKAPAVPKEAPKKQSMEKFFKTHGVF